MKRKPNKELGMRVKVLRKQAGYTQAELAEKLHFDSEKTIAAMENGRRNITYKTAEALADLFKIDIYYLLDENVQFTTAAERYKAAIDSRNNNEEIQANAIKCLSALIGYDVDVKCIYGKNSNSQKQNISDFFSDMRNYATFSKNGKKQFSLSFEETQQLITNISEIYQSNIDLLVFFKSQKQSNA